MVDIIARGCPGVSYHDKRVTDIYEADAVLVQSDD